MLGSNLSFKMVPIQGGTFTIGSAANEKGRNADEGPQKKLSIAAFWMSAYEVTRDELDVFLKDETTSQNINVDAITRPSPQYVDLSLGMGKEGGYPANSMSQRTAIMYCKWLYQKTKVFYRLPTEAEWEYACKAGTNTAYFFGNNAADLDKYAWYEKNSENTFHKVGKKLANPWGLYDMLGNLTEWTMDHYDATAFEKINKEQLLIAAIEAKYPKTLKGGSFIDSAIELRSSKRFHSDPIWNRRDPQIPKSKWWLTEAKQVGIRLLRPFLQPSTEEINQFFKAYLNL
ncbi:MAG: formylglycine-generating enzyme family protein [Sediminibacterium sp.]|nr:MAG: formylglycine-generating enzyme family protein [Sediminibacterium sp.]